MNSTNRTDPSSQSYSQAAEFDRICTEFMAGWDAGRPRSVGDVMAEATPALQEALFEELLEIELRRRRKVAKVDLDTYLRQYSERDSVVRAVWNRIDRDGRLPGPSAPASSAATIEVGKPFGRFEVRAEVDEGAFGEVYRAYDPLTDREVALKLPLMVHLDRERFKTEAKAAGQLHHPNIVTLYEAGDIEGTPYLASLFVTGPTLRDVLKSRPSHRRAAEIVAQLAQALDYAHSKHVIHRDVKPANILFDKQDQPMLTDFGLAWRRDMNPSGSAEVVGTYEYMSPEQFEPGQRTVDGRTDLWSLGVVLYELIVGCTPYKAHLAQPHGALGNDSTLSQGELESTNGMTEEHRTTKDLVRHFALNGGPRRPRDCDRSIPRDLESICLRCLQKEPSLRYASCRELADDLNRWANGEPVKARPAGLLRSGWLWAKRKPQMAAVLAVVVLLATTIAVAAPIVVAHDATLRARAELEQNNAALMTAENYFYRAQKEVQRGQWNSAIPLLDQALSSGHPDPIAVRLLKARAFYATWDWLRARREIEALSHEPDLGPHKGEVLVQHGDMLLLRETNEQSLSLIREGLAAGASPATEAYARALLAESVSEAISHLEVGLTIDPFRPELAQHMVVVLLLTGRRDEARLRARAAESLFPNDPTFPAVLAIIARLEDDPKEETRLLAQLEKKMSPVQLALLRDVIEALGFLKSPLDDWHLGGMKLGGSLKLESAVQTISRLFARATGDAPLGEENVRTLPCLREGYGAVIRLKGRLPLLAINLKQAAEEMREAVENYPDGLAHFVVAVIDFANGHFLEAEQEFLKAAELPSFIPGVKEQALFGAALSQVRPHLQSQNPQDFRRANESVQRRLELGPFPDSQAYVAYRVTVRADDPETGVRIAQQQLTKRPTDIQWLQYLIDLHRKLIDKTTTRIKAVSPTSNPSSKSSDKQAPNAPK